MIASNKAYSNTILMNLHFYFEKLCLIIVFLNVKINTLNCWIFFIINNGFREVEQNDTPLNQTKDYNENMYLPPSSSNE